MKANSILLYILALVISTGVASADLAVVVDPDAFAAGTDISNAFAGVSLSAVGPGWDGTTSSNVLSIDPTNNFKASTGDLVFGHDGSLPPYWREEGLLQLRADFAVISTDVQIDFISDDSRDYGRLLAYDAGGTLVDSADTLQMTAPDQVKTLMVSGDIAYVIAGGIDGQSAVGLDNLQFNPVPVPGAVLLGILGLGVAGVKLRKFS